ncbi:MAG: SUMF1/EgtB/PvdO family nonheme iron enzyme, partial [Chitinophagales bacterium]|nr:SUMF1/EgtB/PvdO family nonheme iron enzyme [Chitinophagales bacterium]
MRFLFLFLIMIGAMQPVSSQVKRLGKDCALLFAVNDYKYMAELNNPVQNARNIAAELEDRYGFRAEVVVNPTIDEIDSKISAYQKRFSNGTYPADGQLFLYFSGHGVQEGVNGYFMASDSDPVRPQRTAMEYDYYRNMINEINCQHILVAIDACHSATFDPSYGARNDNRRFHRKGEEAYDRILVNHKSYRARCFWTSDGQGEETPDRSTFAYQILEGLSSHTSNNGYLRSSELFSVYLEKANPIPGGGNFGSDEPAACFLFFQDKGNQVDPEEQRFWELARDNNTREAYAFYLQLYPNGQYKDQAEKTMRELTSVSTEVPRKTSEKEDELPDMVFVKGGSYQMGSTEGGSDEEPVHAVALSDFYIGRFEVTVEEFSAFIQATGYQTDAEKGDGSFIFKDGSYEKQEGINWRHDATGKRRPGSEHNHPVIHVSWNDAVAYCNWRSEQEGYQSVYTITGNEVTVNWDANGYRLPTEAEWEFAARSRGGSDKWAGTSSESSLPTYGNFCDEKCGLSWKSEKYNDGYAFTAPVGKFRANNLGLHDMSGNVWEWCWHWYDSKYYQSSSVRNPSGPSTGSYRVLRGGSWSSKPASLRCA